MELYVKVSFWIGVVGIVCYSMMLICADYPRLVETSVGTDVVALLITIAVTLWAWRLIWP